MAAQDNLQCRSTAVFFGAAPDGNLSLYTHDEPETGVETPAPSRWIANGWTGRTLAGPDGRMYSITAAGDVNRSRWLGNDWERPGGAWAVTIARGWTGWMEPQVRNRITIDSKGDFYGVPQNDTLRWDRYDESTKAWTSRVLDTGWGKYNMIFAGGEGVLYARRHDGKLYRYQYHANSQRWLEYERYVGSGWEVYTTLTSVGGDVIYGINGNTRDMDWFRYNGSSGFTPSRVIGRGWATDHQVSGMPDSCWLTTNIAPQRPPVTFTEHNRAHLLQSADGGLQFFFVNNHGGLVYGRNSDPNGSNQFLVNTLSGYHDFAGVPTAGQHHDGRLEVLAHGQDSDFRGSTQLGPSGNWASTSDAGGAMAGPAAMTTMADGTLAAFAADNEGKLWYRQQPERNAALRPWRRLQFRAGSWGSGQVPVLSNQQMTVVPAGTSRWLIATDRDGQINVVKFDALNPPGISSVWSQPYKPGFEGRPTGVIRGDGKLQIFARHGDGRIYTKVEDEYGWSTEPWAQLPELANTTGSPSVVMSTIGTVHVLVRTTNGRIHSTKQVSPGSSTFEPWALASQEFLAATDPTAIALSSGRVAYVFRSDEEQMHYFLKPITGGGSTPAPESAWIGGKVKVSK